MAGKRTRNLLRQVKIATKGFSNVLSDTHSFNLLSKAGVLSDTGNCKTYRDDADGYCRADFSGAVVLKRLEDAIAHNDQILVVIFDVCYDLGRERSRRTG